MTRAEVREFLRKGVAALTPSTEFGSGRESEFTSRLNKTYPIVWQNVKPIEIEIADNQAPVNSWEIELIIAKMDAKDSIAPQYEEIIDECDFIAQKLTYQYRNIIAGYKMTTMEGVKREPFVKQKSPDVNTGVMLSFTIKEQDKTNVC